MNPLTRQALLALGYLVALTLDVILFDGLTFIGVFLLLSLMFVLEAHRVILRTWNTRPGTETDSAGSGTGS